MWINPSAKLEAAWAEKTTTQESGGAEIVALRASYEADFATDRPINSNLTPEGSSIAAVQ